MGDEAVRILGICGSHRKEKNTWYALRACMDGIGALGLKVETEIISLAGLHIEDCKGCHACFMPSPGGEFCPVIRDDMNAIYPKLLAADGIIVASPVHWWSATAKMRRFIDRTNPFCGASNGEYGGALYNKAAGVITVAYDVHGGTEVAATHLLTWMLAENMVVVGTQGAHVGGTAATNLGIPPAADDSVRRDYHGMKTVYEVGRRVAEMAYLLKQGRRAGSAAGAGCGPAAAASAPFAAEGTGTAPAAAIAGTASTAASGARPDFPGIDWDRYFEYENSFPKEHVGVEQRLATSRIAFEKFIDIMKSRSKGSGNTWSRLRSEEDFRATWLGRRGLVLLEDGELYALCPEYYDHFLLK